MADVQIENGYTRIANELLEAVYSAGFNATQYKILLLIMRLTYGFGRKSHGISLSSIHNAIGGDKRTLQRELQNLICGRVVQVVSGATFYSSRELAINKNYDTWSERFAPQMVKEPTDGELPTQERNIKKTVKENIVHTPKKSPSKAEVNAFFEEAWKLYPVKRGKGSVSDSQKRILLNIGLDELARCIDRYLKEATPEFYKNGSTFFNSGYVDYLDVDYEPLQAASTKPLERGAYDL